MAVKDQEISENKKQQEQWDYTSRKIYEAIYGLRVEKAVAMLEIIKTDILLNSGAITIDGKVCLKKDINVICDNK